MCSDWLTWESGVFWLVFELLPRCHSAAVPPHAHLQPSLSGTLYVTTSCERRAEIYIRTFHNCLRKKQRLSVCWAATWSYFISKLDSGCIEIAEGLFSSLKRQVTGGKFKSRWDQGEGEPGATWIILAVLFVNEIERVLIQSALSNNQDFVCWRSCSISPSHAELHSMSDKCCAV